MRHEIYLRVQFGSSDIAGGSAGLQEAVSRLGARLGLVRGHGTTIFHAYHSIFSLFTDADEHRARVDAEGLLEDRTRTTEVGRS